MVFVVNGKLDNLHHFFSTLSGKANSNNRTSFPYFKCLCYQRDGGNGKPPETFKICPVIKSDILEQRKSAASAISSMLPTLFNGDLPKYLTAKDMILQVLGDITTDGGTYRALEFEGDAVFAMEMDERMTLTNMAIEAGAMNGIIKADEVTEKYVKERTSKPYEIFESDPDAVYKAAYKYDASKMEPMVAKPHSPDNKDTVRNVHGTKLTKCYIGSCTGGKLSDFVNAAKIIFGSEVKVPTFIVPASTLVAQQLEVDTINGISLKQIFENAGCEIAQSSCAACLGGPSDTIGRAQDGEVVISTTNRNFPGRMGSKKSQVYLASPYSVAASAINGVITDPREYL